MFQILFFKPSVNNFNIQSVILLVLLWSPCFKKINLTKEVYKAEKRKSSRRTKFGIWLILQEGKKATNSRYSYKMEVNASGLYHY